MKISSSRLYPYPILSPMYDDYVNSTFKIEVKAYKKVKKLLLRIHCELQNDELLELIKEKKAKVVCHFECPKTKFRYLTDLKLADNSFEIKSSDINNQLQIIAFIIAKDSIEHFNSKDFNKDYGNAKFSFEPCAILAISNQLVIPIEKDIYELSNVPSIISVVPYNEEKNNKRMIVDMDSDDKIRILLFQDEYKKYAELGNGISNFTPILYSILIIPALIYVFETLKSDESVFQLYESKRWFKVLKKKLESMDKKFDYENIRTLDSLELAQEIIETPLVDSLSNLLLLGGE